MGNHAELIKDEIMRCLRQRRLLPGDPVNEKDLQERLSVSATPMREALISLEADAIVERRRGGAVIAELDFESMMKLVEILAELDGTFAALASQRITPAQAEVLQAKTNACLDHVKNGGESSFYEKNYEFHLAVAVAAGNEFLIDYANRVVRRLFPYLSMVQELPGEQQRSAEQHKEICDAILDSNAQLARDLMIKHGELSQSVALAVMNGIRSRTRGRAAS